ncbi:MULTISPECIES: shikimate dehydrogenase [unclassified Rhizobium]|uniref:shikimate dehydrogenase n=1 Tax=unclassified Rhizobium TaxID=2613769 RepID=UPI0006FCD79A|nr:MULTISPECIES: shikimate dehydrogenase [unclassified Rhizobium]KQV35827.1 shikimate dehydrogenase [Rhizobium sp. Root1212]KRD25934.1 shikimate dehydrogenase [Rhizobium sp. Root268]
MDDSRETFVNHAFVAGYPIKHSRSPLIHGYWLKSLGLQGSYRTAEVTPDKFPGFIADLKSGSSGFIGGNVTIPHKEAAFAVADRPDEIAREIGAANTLWREDGLVHATNTDGIGFTANLDAFAPGWDRIDTAVILGAGGASRAVIQSVRDRGVKTIHVLNRTVSRAQELADRFGPAVHAQSLDALGEVLSGAGLLINTTSLGMDGGEVPEFDFTLMRSDAVVTDIVYVPLKTPILSQAEAQGFRIVDGLGMLLHQAAPGFEKWFGVRPTVDAALRQLIIDDMAAHA